LARGELVRNLRSLATQPRSARGTIKAFGAGLGPRQFRGVASTGVVDRMEDIVVPEGGDVSEFRRNPILLYQHDSTQPIGTVPSIALVAGRWEFLAEFAPEGVSEKADEACRLVKCGVLSALSIGFLPSKIERIPNSNGVRFTKWSLLELSVVSVPACPDALVTERTFVADQGLTARIAALKARLSAPARLFDLADYLPEGERSLTEIRSQLAEIRSRSNLEAFLAAETFRFRRF
jgi:HK97 family phage prohead protease